MRTEVETLASMVEMIEAHQSYSRTRRASTYPGGGATTEERGLCDLDRACDEPIVFADSTAKVVTCELGHFHREAGRDPKILVWRADDGVPPEVSLLRGLQGEGSSAISARWLAEVRPALPVDVYDQVAGAVRDAERAIDLRVTDGVAEMSWHAGEAPKFPPYTWTLNHTSGHGEIKMTMTVHVKIAGVSIRCWHTLDVKDSYDDPVEFREYVECFNWQDAGARLVFGSPPKSAAGWKRVLSGERPAGYRFELAADGSLKKVYRFDKDLEYQTILKLPVKAGSGGAAVDISRPAPVSGTLSFKLGDP